MTSGEDAPLTRVLLARAPEDRRDWLREWPGLEALLAGHLSAGEGAWPTVKLTPESFLRHLARHLPAPGAPEDALRQLHAADLYLACACAEGEPQALLAFEQHVLRKVPARLGSLPAATLDEVLQMLRQRLLLGVGGAPPRIADYAGRGPLLAWVRIVAARMVGAMSSQNGRQELFSEPPEALDQLLAPDNPEREVLRADSSEAFSLALRAALAALPERERALLRMHHLHGLTMDRLATMYGESRSSIARHVAQARERLLRLTRHELAARLKLEGRELESLLGLVRSRLDLNLGGMMD
ncbi:putative DNA-binding regulatory protein [Cystobacter fuscus DSM 2262]|uniref:DNA-binding regulatory protein n=1 Tax=Cystobacter fuscus (strain ATCC 25194 / DSM 2262 / NBRC 100088 / M29) TaxID=1242864 RepID=S9PQD1_CYSF2|nr:sigma-70 family RNA polymerase sigma factor [Cystobacter fuscus]EPX64677.1 putative DNA-binding regulatory protein [Cystobacter fuscus DSM 2262]